MSWPTYSAACRNSVNLLLEQGGSLSAYKANRAYGPEPKLNSWACRLERQLEMRMGVKHAVAVNSGTAGLHCALVAAGITSGEVITSPYTFSATASAILLAGATPVFADVDPQTFTITPETVRRLVSRRTRGILPVSLFGGLAPVKALSDFGVPVIEDACQAVGAVDGQAGLPDGVVAKAFSFNGGKNIPAGECGAVLFDSSKLSSQARYLSNHGENFSQLRVGYNFRPNEVTCCIAYHGLVELNENNRQRIALAEALTGLIRAERKLESFIEVPESVKFDGSHVYYCYPFKLHRITRSRFAKRMKFLGITVGEGYIRPALHEYKAFRKYAKGHLPVVENLSRESLCLLYDIAPGQPMEYAHKVVEAMVLATRDRR